MRFHSGTFPIHHKPREVQITMVTLHGWWLISWSRFLGCWLDVNFTGRGYCWRLLPAGIQKGRGRETYKTVCLLPQAVRCCWGWVHFFMRFSNVNLQAIVYPEDTLEAIRGKILQHPEQQHSLFGPATQGWGFDGPCYWPQLVGGEVQACGWKRIAIKVKVKNGWDSILTMDNDNDIGHDIKRTPSKSNHTYLWHETWHLRLDHNNGQFFRDMEW